jgi:NitT/TauT family transport system substrate-binding protein
MMKAYLKSIKAGFVAAAIVALACLSVPASAEDMVKGNGGQIRWYYNAGGTTSYLVYVFKKFELGKKYNIDLIPTPNTSSAAALVAMQNGSAQLTNLGWNDIARLKMGGYDVIGVAPWLRWGADFYVVQKDSPIKTLADLKGKKIGTSGKISLNHILLKTVAKKHYGVDIEKDAETLEGAQPLLRGLLEQGNLDVAGMFNSFTPAMIASGKFRSLVKLSELVTQYGLPDTPYLMYGFDGKYAKANPENVKAFVKGFQEAIHILKTNDEVWLEEGRNLQQSDEVSALFRELCREDIADKFDETTEKNIRVVFDQFLPIAGEEAFGINKLPEGFMTLAYQ